MPTTKDVRGECQHCQGQFDFPAEHAGLTADCPFCGQPTELLLATPSEESSPIRKKAIIFTVIAVVILVGGLVAAMVAVNRARHIVGEKPATVSAPAAPTNPFAGQNFRALPVTLDKTSGSKIVYAVGSIINTAAQQRFGVKVELELLDAGGNPVATASDYIATIEANAEWKFRALVVEPKAVSARVAAIKETK